MMQDRDALVEEVSEPEQGDRGEPPEDYVSGLLSSSYHGHKPGSGELRHGTEGWQALETSFVVRHLTYQRATNFSPAKLLLALLHMDTGCRLPSLKGDI